MMGFEPTCYQLPFLQCIRLRGYIPNFATRPTELKEQFNISFPTVIRTQVFSLEGKCYYPLNYGEINLY